MAKIISLFNHKGGVSKTTTTFNLGWAMAEAGKKILIVDADPQCNLTGTVLGFNKTTDFNDFYKKNPHSNLNTALDPVFQGAQSPLNSAIPVSVTNNPNLCLLAGHIDLSESETQIAVALSVGSALPAMRNIPGAISHLLRITGTEHEIDAIVVDMSPSIGALNECILMGSDFFIVPTSPDYYCDQAVQSLSRVLPRWNSDISPFRDQSLAYCFPQIPPQFLGIVSQRYRPRQGAPAASFQSWIDQIKGTIDSTLVPTLSNIGMIISSSQFTSVVTSDTPYNLENISDFNTLIAQSQKHNTPVFALSDEQIEKSGIVLETMKASRDSFKQIFQRLAQVTISLTGI